ncbi:hypothetical protein [Roseibium sp.]|uniref:hypothetical protein n=1 Tax=Roseibium sp. TaxID=1936156 RepID=UPI001B07D3EE|nr:hypothetical protein [Roseibium sp.]MBO6857442.1 hypothetical protein [Roseibium sp.]
MGEKFPNCKVKSKDGAYTNVKYTFTCTKADGTTKEVKATLPSGNDSTAVSLCKNGDLP